MASLVQDANSVIEELLVSSDQLQILKLSYVLSSMLKAYVQVIPYNGNNAILYQPYGSNESYLISPYMPMDTGVVNENGGALDLNPQTLA